MINWKHIALPLVLAACARSEKDDTGDTDRVQVDTFEEVTPLEVAALGFEYFGGWNEDLQLLENILLPDPSGASGQYPYVLVTLASLQYFEMSQTASGFDDEYCAFAATLVGTPAELIGKGFDYDEGKGGTGEELETWGSFAGYLEIDEGSFSDRCTELDPLVFENGDPMALLDGMHFGIGFGPAGDHVAEAYADDETFQETPNAFMTQYIAINHPDGAGGYTFDAYDWNGGILIEADYETCEDFVDANGDPLEICGLAQVDDEDFFVLGDTTLRPRHGYLRGFSTWLEDTPNLDLGILKQGGR